MRRPLLGLSLFVVACLALSAPRPRPAPVAGTISGTTAPGLNGHVTALHRVGTALYLGGNFTNAGGIAAADRIAKWDGMSGARSRHDAARQRIGLCDRALRRQGLRGRHLRQRRRPGGRRLPRGLRRRQLEAVLQLDREPRLQHGRSPGPRAPGGRLDPLRRRHLPERERRPACRLPDRLRPRDRRAEPDRRQGRRLHRRDLRPGGDEDGTLYAGGTFTNLDRRADGRRRRGVRRLLAGTRHDAHRRDRPRPPRQRVWTCTSARTASTSAGSHRPITS